MMKTQKDFTVKIKISVLFPFYYLKLQNSSNFRLNIICFVVHCFFFCTCKFTFVSSYLALVAALATEADYVFIPEDPAVVNWQEKLCHKLLQVHYLKEARTQFYI